MMSKENLNTTLHTWIRGVLQASQVMVQQLVEKGMLKGSIPKLDNFNGDPQSTKISFHVWEKQVMALEGDYTPASIRIAIRIVSKAEHYRIYQYCPLTLIGRFYLRH